MGIFSILLIGLSALFLINIVLPWINWAQIKRLRHEVDQLKALSMQTQASPIQTAEKIVEPIPVKPAQTKIADVVSPQLKTSVKVKEKNNFEQQFGVRLTVWVGAIAMLLAGFFLVKYSIMAGLLTENVRVILGGVFALMLLVLGQWINQKTRIANYLRISQALIGAGIALLYVCVFAATSLYHLLPNLIGFFGMMIVTAVAVVLSLRHGAPIALLGLLGGLLTPALIHSEQANAFLLFGYLYLVMAGLFIVIRQRAWWFLLIPALIGAFLWTIIWLCYFFTPGDSLWLGIFIIAVTGTFVGCTYKASQQQTLQLPFFTGLESITVLNYFALGIAIILLGVISARGDYGLLEWSLFGVLAAGCIALAYLDQKTYGFVPLFAMLVNGVMLGSWYYANSNLFVEVIVSLGLLYCLTGYYFLWRAVNPLLWAALTSGASLIYFVTAYYHFHHATFFIQSDFWATLAFGLGSLAALSVWQIVDKFGDADNYQQKLLALFILVTVAFVSIGLALILKQEFLSIAFAAEICTLSWMSKRVAIKSIRPIIIALLALFVLLLMPQVWFFIQLIFQSISNSPLSMHVMIPIANNPILQLGVPFALLLGASYYLSKYKVDELVDVLQMVSITLFALMGYCIIRNALHLGINWLAFPASFIERGVLTNFFFIVALTCLWFGYAQQQRAIVNGGIILGVVAILRTIYFDLLLYNPLWFPANVGEIPIFNGLFITFLLPVLWIYLANRLLTSHKNEKYLLYANIFSLFLLFTFISLSVRQFYWGGILTNYGYSSPEIYTYSLVWLLLAIGLLIVGTLRHDKAIRMASLLLMLLTVGKVFLFDASALTGLYRVFSFFGLGLILIGLSWFYTRFVFIDKKSLPKE